MIACMALARMKEVIFSQNFSLPEFCASANSLSLILFGFVFYSINSLLMSTKQNNSMY